MGYRRGSADRPWLMANFIATIDGATVVEGGSTAISDDDDRAMFHALRAVADVILVGAGTVRAENYGPVRMDEARRTARLANGLDESPRMVLVTASLGLDPDHRVFSDPERRVTVLTGPSAPLDRSEALSGVADVVRLDSTRPENILEYLGEAGVILCEGGATLVGHFVAARLLDEMALTVAPVLVAGESNRVAQGEGAKPPLEMRLDRVLYGERDLFLRYVRNETG